MIVPSFNNMTSANSIGFPVPFSRMFPLICEAVAIKEWKQNIKKMRVNVLFMINVLNVMRQRYSDTLYPENSTFKI